MFCVATVGVIFVLQTTVLQTAHDTVRVGDAVFVVDIVRTPRAQALGLSGRSSLPANHGMLFPFAPKATVGFWMKDMLFPIDIIWIADERVIGIEERAMPDDRPERTIYYPPAPIDTVLEIGAHEARRLGIIIDSAVHYSYAR